MEYIKLKDVLHILDLVMSDNSIKHKGKAIRKRLKELPGEDVEKVVRCKDCIYSRRDYRYRFGYACEKPLYHPEIGERRERKLMQDIDFCSHGVRKEGAEG